MRCETCFGLGNVLIDRAGNVVPLVRAILLVPCPDCGGSGIANCCDATGENGPCCLKREERDA